jgi:hypothetical protein
MRRKSPSEAPVNDHRALRKTPSVIVLHTNVIPLPNEPFDGVNRMICWSEIHSALHKTLK